MESPSQTVFNPEVVKVWAQYAKERYDAHEKRLADQRGWARQLAAGLGAVVGLEAGLLALVLKVGGEDGVPRSAWILWLLVLLGLVIAYQLLTLARAVRVGYVGQELLGAESPVILAEHLEGKDERWARRTIGAYYAKGADNVHAVAEIVAKQVAVVASQFRLSLVLLFIVILLTGGLAALSSFARKPMAEDPTLPGPSPVVSTPDTQHPVTSPLAPAPTSPLLVTPTPGQTETKAAAPPRATMISTPTPGQRLTEGREVKQK